jgi:hypothetical protein
MLAVPGDTLFPSFHGVLEHFFLLPQISKQKVSVAQSLPET